MAIALPSKAMVLAAGMGTRMRPLTDTHPKALVEVDGTALVDHTLDHLANAGVAEAMVNHHYLGEQLLDHLSRRKGSPVLSYSDESDELLETGGGIFRALSFFEGQPFFSINSDAIWTDSGTNALQQMANAFDPDQMDALLLLIATEDAGGHTGAGDFFLSDEGALTRRGDATSAPYVYTGIQLLHPRLFRDCPTGPFSLNVLYSRAITEGRLFGTVHTGKWHDVGTPEGRIAAEQMLKSSRNG